MNNTVYGKYERREMGGMGRNDTGTAARFYFNADWSYEVAERLATCDPVKYQS